MLPHRWALCGRAPSRQKFLEMVGSDKVREIGEHRAAGLASQWLLAATETPLAGETGQRCRQHL